MKSPVAGGEQSGDWKLRLIRGPVFIAKTALDVKRLIEL